MGTQHPQAEAHQSTERKSGDGLREALLLDAREDTAGHQRAIDTVCKFKRRLTGPSSSLSLQRRVWIR